MRSSERLSGIAGKEVPSWLSATLVLATVGGLIWLERRRPLRRCTQDKRRRDLRNLAVAGLSAVAISRFEKPVVQLLSRWVDRERWGLLKALRLPVWLEVPLAIVLLDYTLYVWHVLTHKVGFLWRFHVVHHADLDMDLTTAIRFHFGEMILSVPWRAAQVLLIGASPLALTTWQLMTLLAILFHHSDVELPHWLERRLCRLIVTPRVHGIHHSVVRWETDSNWSTIFTWPDVLHGTIRLNVPQDEVTIGVAGYRDPEELKLPDLVRMPFAPQRPSWELHESDLEATRRPEALPEPIHTLAE